MRKIWITLLMVFLIISTIPVLAKGQGASGNERNVGNAVEGGKNIRNIGATEKLAGAKIKATAIKEKLQARKMEVKQLRNRLLECKRDGSDDCKQLRKEAKVSVRNFLVKAAEKSMDFLRKARQRISKSKLSEEEKTTALNEIDNEINELSQTKTETEAKAEITDRNQLKNTVGKIKSSWGRVRSNIAMKLHKTHLQRFGNVFKKTDLLDQKLKRMLNKLSVKGVDTSNVDIRPFNSKLSEAKTAFEEANKFFEDAKAESGEKRKGLLSQAREKMKESHRLLKDAKDLLKEVLKNLRQTRTKAREQGIDLEEPEQETEEPEEEEQPETEEETEEQEETETLNTEETQE